jgi:oxygen-independent coproporphyrinogen-3 oxidase
MDSLGLYISFPFCRAKCSYCNFASDVFAPARMQQYVDRLCAELSEAGDHAEFLRAELPKNVDTVYFGGGTPSLIASNDLAGLFQVMREQFSFEAGTEITMECAPGQLSDDLLETWLRLGVNRVSLGVQSFIDRESAAVGRLHTRAICVAEITRLRQAGIQNINVDLIAGLPFQTAASWDESLTVLLETGVPHASVYMFEIDEDSRLGLEILNNGDRYRAADAPPDELVAEFYLTACNRLNQQGIAQYEISNFARAGFESSHNLRYWLRQPYLGMGLDAHSMLKANAAGYDAMRFANTDDMDKFCASEPYLPPDGITPQQALEEEFFLGLRRNAGINLAELKTKYGAAVDQYSGAIAELEAGDPEMDPFLLRDGEQIRLTDMGRLLSNEVFGRLLESAMA